MPSDRFSGSLLIGSAAVVAFAMAHHPTGHAIARAESGHAGRVSVIVHGVMIAVLPAVVTGLAGLSRRLRWSGPALTGLVVYGFAAVAGMAAAVASGFVVTPLLREMGEAASGREALRDMAGLAGLFNHGFAAVTVVGWGVAMLLWGGAMAARSGAMRAGGIGGLVAGVVMLLGFFSGRLGLDVHGFLILSLVHAAWLVWAGILLCLPESAPGREPAPASAEPAA